MIVEIFVTLHRENKTVDIKDYHDIIASNNYTLKKYDFFCL